MQHGSVSNSTMDNSTHNWTHGLRVIRAPYQLVWTPDVTFRVTTIVIVMVLTIIGNSTLIAVLSTHRQLRGKRVNVFLVNLAVGDLMVCLVTMSTEILFLAHGEWVLGAAACKLVVYAQIVTLASATFLLTAMSMDRYQVLVRPLQALAGRHRVWRQVLLAWLLALLFAAPQLLIFVQTDEGVREDGSVRHLCRSKGYTAAWQRKLYFSFLTAYILVLPTVIMSYCYLNIIRAVWLRTAPTQPRPRQPKLRMRFITPPRPPPPHAPPNSHTRPDVEAEEECIVRTRRDALLPHSAALSIPPKLLSSSKRNVVKMTLSVILGFVLCWTPYFVVGLIRIFTDYRVSLRRWLAAAEILAMVHSALNPLLYGVFSTRAARRLCVCRPRPPRHEDLTPPSDNDSTWGQDSSNRGTGYDSTHRGYDSTHRDYDSYVELVPIDQFPPRKHHATVPLTRCLPRPARPPASHSHTPRLRNGYQSCEHKRASRSRDHKSASRSRGHSVISSRAASHTYQRHGESLASRDISDDVTVTGCSDVIISMGAT